MFCNDSIFYFPTSAGNVQVDDSTAISLLEAACLNLAIMSSKRLSENHIYRRMVWGTLLVLWEVTVINCRHSVYSQHSPKVPLSGWQETG